MVSQYFGKEGLHNPLKPSKFTSMIAKTISKNPFHLKRIESQECKKEREREREGERERESVRNRESKTPQPFQFSSI